MSASWTPNSRVSTRPSRVALSKLCEVLDTLALARGMHPGQRNNLDALCKRYGIDNSHRELHGALLDARILADVYLAMTGGQSALALDEAPRRAARRHAPCRWRRSRCGQRAAASPGAAGQAASAAERAAHELLLELLQKESGGQCLWRGKES